MKIAATGFVSEKAGSVASANALLLRALIKSGHTVHFFSKASFIDPRPAVGADATGFRFVDVDNVFFDRLRRRLERIPIIGMLACRIDAWSYNRKLIRVIGKHHQESRYDVCLWMGDYASGRVKGLPSISFAQGAPGSDARSIIDRKETIIAVAGKTTWLKWRILSMLRLSRWGLPPFRHSDHFIVGSTVSKDLLVQQYKIDPKNASTLPYPIDLELFKPSEERRIEKSSTALRVLWLGRIVPRKRLEIFLEGSSLAIEQGLDLHLTIVGQVGFIPGYEKLIHAFPHPHRLTWIESLPRRDIPSLFHRHDVLCQPSDEENFGSSVAEAQACGIPVIVGATNGNRDYLCDQDIELTDDDPESLSMAFFELAGRSSNMPAKNQSQSTRFAQETFALDKVVQQLEEILKMQIQ